MATASAVEATPAVTIPPLSASAAREPLHTKSYYCRALQGVKSCNVCHYRPAEMAGKPGETPTGDSTEGRIEGTNVTKAELAEKQIRYLQVGGDWWNKCGDGWLNVDFVFTRLPIGFVCEDWRTGRYILRQDAGRRWPFEDSSFDIVYSEHMFEHSTRRAARTASTREPQARTSRTMRKPQARAAARPSTRPTCEPRCRQSCRWKARASCVSRIAS